MHDPATQHQPAVGASDTFTQAAPPPVGSQELPKAVGRQTNWWALGAMAAAALVAAVVIRANRQPAAPTGPTKTNFIELRDAAIALRERGQLPQAERAALAAVELGPALYGPQHFAVADSLNMLALVYTDQAKYAEAVKAYERAIPILQQVFGGMSKEAGQAAGNLGLTLTKAGDYAEARPLFEKVLEIMEETTGPDSLDTALAVNNLAYMLDSAGDHAAARPFHERAYTTRRQALDDVAKRLLEIRRGFKRACQRLGT